MPTSLAGPQENLGRLDSVQPFSTISEAIEMTGVSPIDFTQEQLEGAETHARSFRAARTDPSAGKNMISLSAVGLLAKHD